MIDYKVVSGICRPQTYESLEIYKGIQREINRVYDAKNKKLIRVDGRIGDDTRGGVNFILGTSFKTCSEVADRVSMLLGQLKSFANNQQLPIVADPDYIIANIISPPSRYDPDTNTVVHSNFASAGPGNVPWWLIALGGFGGYYYFYKTKEGKKTRKSLMGKS